MYTLKVKVGRSWKDSLHIYTYEEAMVRKEQMEKVGHKVRIVKCGG